MTEQVSAKTAIGRVQEIIEAAISTRGSLRVLDAGCGSDSSRAGFPVPRAFESAHVLGVDVDIDALEQNPLLDERLAGDIESIKLPENTFDVVVTWDVLEHLPHPLAAIENVSRAVAPGGILVVGIPNLWSLKGLATKLTPFWFHRLIYRRVFGLRDEAHGPFRTYLRRAIAPSRLRMTLEEMGFETKLAVLYGADAAGDMFGSHGWARRIWQMASLITSALSLGQLSPNRTEAAFVFQRRTEVG